MNAILDEIRADAASAWSSLRATESPRKIWRVAVKEFAGFFASPAAMIFLGVFLAASMFSFFWVERFFARNTADLRPLFQWMPVLLIFLVSALTMRLWSEERRSGALEFLLTSSVKPYELLFGKALACLGLVAVALALTFPLALMTGSLGPLDWGPVFGGYLATLCLAAAYIAIGLFVSAQTDNQIVSLVGAAVICGVFHVIGTPALTNLVGNDGGEWLRALGAGARFESITRGVIDLRDLFYYVSIFGVFSVATLYMLERARWAKDGARHGHARSTLTLGLIAANLVAGNFWLAQLGGMRLDLTEGAAYSLSDATERYLSQLEEPLLIRGYFSAETHPLLAPLAPRLADLLREYEVVGDGRVRVEIIDPQSDPALEEEAARRYGLRPQPFQTESRYQTAVTNSYFDIVVQYGDAFQVLNYDDLISITQTPSAVAVDLRNPEYDLTRAIRRVQSDYRAAGAVFDALDAPVSLTLYASAEEALPERLRPLRAGLIAMIEAYERDGGDKFVGEILDPTADDGAIAAELQENYGLQPLRLTLFDDNQFWLHLVLGHRGQLLQAPLPEDLSVDSVKRVLDAEIKRFAPGALRSVALYTPPTSQGMPQFGVPPSGLQFQSLRRALEANFNVVDADLSTGRAPEAADLLFVVAPEALDQKAVFAIDQFLMRGGAVVVSTSAFQPLLNQGLGLQRKESGLDEWLARIGVTMEPVQALDAQNTSFPAPVSREVGGMVIREYAQLNYPHFIDLRAGGLAGGAAPTSGIGQITWPWGSPIALDAEKIEGLRLIKLAETTGEAWTSAALEAIPDYQRYPDGYAIEGERGELLLGVSLEGRFRSAFAGDASPLLPSEEPAAAEAEAAETPEAASAETADAAAAEAEAQAEAALAPASVIERSPESATLVVLGSASLFADEMAMILQNNQQADVTAPFTLAQNLVDWALEDRSLLALRSRQAAYARTLDPVSSGGRAAWETMSYVMALAGLVLVWFLHRRWSAARSARRLAALGLARPAAANDGGAA